MRVANPADGSAPPLILGGQTEGEPTPKMAIESSVPNNSLLKIVRGLEG